MLILSLFPGIGLLDMAFEEEGFCVVRGPDLIWGGDVKLFHPPAGKFEGIIGGPPCQAHSSLVHIVRAVHGEDSVAEDLIPEFVRCISESRPQWFLMENVPKAPVPRPTGYLVHSQVFNNRWLGEEQNRVRRFSFGTHDGRQLHITDFGLTNPVFEPAVCSTAGGRRASVAIGGSGKPKGNQGHDMSARLRNRSIADELRLQGLPPDFLSECSLTERGKRKAISNGVPLPLGRAIARAVRAAIEEKAAA